MATLPQKAQPKWQVKRKRKDSPHKAKYQSAHWKGSAKSFFSKPENQICVWYGQRVKCQKKATIRDHIDAMTDGGLYSGPLQPMCKSCSAAKTNMEVANRTYHNNSKTITPTGLV